MMTAVGGLDVATEAVRNGVSDFVEKPFDDLDHLMGKVRALL